MMETDNRQYTRNFRKPQKNNQKNKIQEGLPRPPYMDSTKKQVTKKKSKIYYTHKHK
jgi:hypothetical protein